MIEGLILLQFNDKTHQGGYYHQTNSNKPLTHIIPPDGVKVEGACYDIKKYLNLQPENAEKHFFLHVNKDSEGKFLLNKLKL